MTAGEAAAQIAAQSAVAQAAYNSGGAYLNGAIVAGGTPGGQTLAGLTTPAPGSNIFGATGLTQLSGIAKSLAAGYYQIPGQQGAQYFDPASGQAPSQAFISWANGLTATDLGPNGQPTSGFIPVEGGVEAYNNAQPSDVATVTAITGLMNSGMSAEDAQNKVLGIGPNQQFAVGADGQQVRVGAGAPTYAAPTPGGGGSYKDVSTFASNAPVGGLGVGGSMGFWAPVAGGSMWVSTATPTDIANNEADATAAENALEANNSEAWTGLQMERIAAGEDPNTGISAAETEQIFETYSRIQDPGEAAAFLAAQDPGNLTPGLRVARNNTPEMQSQNSWMAENKIAPITTWEGTAAYGGTEDEGGAVSEYAGAVRTTFGDVTETDAATGRSIMFGNVVTDRVYVAPSNEGLTINGHNYISNADGARVIGGIEGAVSGFFTGLAAGGGPVGGAFGAVMGAYEGAGGWLPNAKNISFTKAGGWSQWKAGAPVDFNPASFLETLAAASIIGWATGATSPEAKAESSYFYGAPSKGFMAKYGMAGLQAAWSAESVTKARQAQGAFS